ncbi:MAG: DnaJ domain-containing protein [Edaphocola sp.]
MQTGNDVAIFSIEKLGAILKDYYRILEIGTKATPGEVKKSFRRLAHLYHPDKAADNQFAAARFGEIQEAYGILSKKELRDHYDYERWLHGYGDRVAIASPEFLCKEVSKLIRLPATADVYRLNKELLHDYLQFLLTDEKMAILLQPGEAAAREAFAGGIVDATKVLPYYFALPVLERLRPLAQTGGVRHWWLSERKSRRRQGQWHKWHPWLAMLVVAALLLLMYVYVRR